MTHAVAEHRDVPLLSDTQVAAPSLERGLLAARSSAKAS